MTVTATATATATVLVLLLFMLLLLLLLLLLFLGVEQLLLLLAQRASAVAFTAIIMRPPPEFGRKLRDECELLDVGLLNRLH